MPSMSYCMFENTLSELRQCVDRMEEAESLEYLALNRYEQPAFMEMYELCQEFVRLHESLCNTEDQKEVDLSDKCFV
jgi:exonuclease VII small subunit